MSGFIFDAKCTILSIDYAIESNSVHCMLIGSPCIDRQFLQFLFFHNHWHLFC